MKITWFGHSCFLLESEKGTKLLTDPFEERAGYDVPDVKPDIVTVSHEHWDHNAVHLIKGEPEVIRDNQVHDIKNFQIRGIDTYHDEVSGAKRGSNTVYVFAVDGLNVCHLGDLGHILSEKQIKEIGSVDILMIPVGGTFTLDAREASEVVKQIKPKLVIPMHFKTPDLSFEIALVDDFLGIVGHSVRANGQTIDVMLDTLPEEQQLLVLDYKS